MAAAAAGVFHEKQYGSLCAQHAINALLQGPYFTAVELSQLAGQLDEEELQRMSEGGLSSELMQFMNVSASHHMRCILHNPIPPLRSATHARSARRILCIIDPVRAQTHALIFFLVEPVCTLTYECMSNHFAGQHIYGA